jgi:GNAT superfamily N-acetyltransferase
MSMKIDCPIDCADGSTRSAIKSALEGKLTMTAAEYTEYTKDNFSISTNQGRLDIETIHNFLTNAYWSKKIPRSIVEKAIRHSLCFGVYDDSTGAQIGLARVVSDCATFAYLADVFILESYRGRGLSKWLMQCVLTHPELQGLRRFMLATLDAHGLYHQFGFDPLEFPERLMAIVRPNIYEELAEQGNG